MPSKAGPLVRRLHRRTLDGSRLTGDGESLLRSLPKERIVPIQVACCVPPALSCTKALPPPLYVRSQVDAALRQADAARRVLGVVLLGFVADGEQLISYSHDRCSERAASVASALAEGEYTTAAGGTTEAAASPHTDAEPDGALYAQWWRYRAGRDLELLCEVPLFAGLVPTSWGDMPMPLQVSAASDLIDGRVLVRVCFRAMERSSHSERRLLPLRFTSSRREPRAALCSMAGRERSRTATRAWSTSV